MNRTDILAILMTAVVLAGCSASTGERIAAANAGTVEAPIAAPPAPASMPEPPALTQTAAIANPHIVRPARRMQCVPYAREQSGIEIRGDAWTWWQKAAGSYERSTRPAVGAVIVFSRTKRNRYGHLAVVTEIVNDREIIARHANWLNKGQIHIDTPIRDVSRNNDWSAVRVWYTPGNVLGKSDYPVSGFILPPQQQASD